MDKILLVSLVKKEASKLKKEATKKQLSFLNFSNLDSGQSDRCIYGQMTGDCFNLLASELIKKCCKRVYTQNNSIDLMFCSLNGKPTFNDREYRDKRWFSPIECFIDFTENENNGNNEMLIAY